MKEIIPTTDQKTIPSTIIPTTQLVKEQASVALVILLTISGFTNVNGHITFFYLFYKYNRLYFIKYFDYSN